MASVSLVKIIEKMKLENLTPDIDVRELRLPSRILTVLLCRWQVILSILRQRVFRLSAL